MPTKNETAICRDLNLLRPDFRSIIACVMRDLEKMGSNLKPFETMRSLERQKWLFKNKKSKTLKSKHIEGIAIDFVVFKDGKWSWDDLEEFRTLGRLINDKYPDLEWGGNWRKFVDMPHIQFRDYVDQED